MSKRVADSDPVLAPGPSGASPTVTPVDGEESVYRTSHDMSANGLSVTITQALSEVSGIPVTELVSDFSEYADPDAIDRLFRTPANRTDVRNDGQVVLWIRGYRVTVHGDGRIRIAAHDA